MARRAKDTVPGYYPNPSQTAEQTYAAIHKFWKYAQAGKNTALDMNLKTKEMLAHLGGKDGKGTITIPYTDDWVRVIEFIDGRVKSDSF